MDGYERLRPLSRDERYALFAEAQFSAVRFTITRITDYAMRYGAQATKDFRRYRARYDALSALGREGLHSLLFGGDHPQSLG